MLKKVYLRSVPELEMLSAEDQEKAFESARYHAFRDQPGRGAKNLVAGLLIPMIVPVLVCLVAPGWALASTSHMLLLVAIPAVIASPIFQWLQARTIVPVLRAELQRSK